MRDHISRAGGGTPPVAKDKTHPNNTTQRPNWVRHPLQFWELLSYRLSPDEVSAYLRLFHAAAHAAGRLPLPLASVAKRVRVNESTVDSLVSDYPELFELDGDDLVVLLAAEEVARAKAISAERSAAGKRSSEVRRQRLRLIDGGAGDE